MPNTIERVRSLETAGETRRVRSGAAWQHLQSIAWAFDAQIRRHENLVLALALAILTLFSLLFARRQPFDVDEYLVRITALAGSPGAIWHLLKTAPISVDPPLFHVLVHYCLGIFGPGEFAARIPSILSYTLMSLLLYRLVRRYADVYTGLALVALCLLVGAFNYSYDARPYTLLLAADALALVCWANLVEERPSRSLSLLGLFLGIAVAIGSHWFGFLLLIPLAVGEAVRTWQRRRVDLATCITLSASAATMLFYLPLLKAASEYRALPWKGVEFSDISGSFHLVLDNAPVPLALLLVVSALASFGFKLPPPRPERTAIPTPVFVCLLAFALAPFPVFVIGRFVTHAFAPRYALLCAIGLLVLGALAIRDALHRSALWLALAILIVGGFASVIRYRSLAGIPAGGDTTVLANVTALSGNPSLPVVAGGDGLFLRIEAHSPAALRERCIFVTDPDFIRLLHQNTNFLMTEGLRRWTNFPISDLPPFLHAHPQFYFIQIAGQDWLLQRLAKDHAGIVLQGEYAGNPVYLIDVRH